MPQASDDHVKSQLVTFKKIEREVEADKDAARRDKRLTKVAKHKLAPEKPE